MDPLSLAASIAGLLSLAGSVISAGYTVSMRLKRGTDEIKAVTNEVAAFSGILVGVNSVLRPDGHGPSCPPGTQALLDDCRNTLNEISEILGQLTNASRLSLVLTGDEKEKRLEKLAHRIEQYKSFFVLCFHLENSSNSETIKSKMEFIIQGLQGLRLTQQTVQDSVDKLEEIERMNKRNKICRWLGEPTADEHTDLCATRVANTGEWILRKPEFEGWFHSASSSFFWLNGTQGSGKSMVMSKIIDTIQEMYLDQRSPSAVGLVFHYCRFSSAMSLSSTRLIGSLVVQLLRQAHFPDDVMASIETLYTKHQRKSTTADFQEVKTLFLQLALYFESVFLIIDGLDEMTDRWDILDLLESLSSTDAVFKVLVASRGEMDLNNAFSYFCRVTISAQDTADDLRRYVSHQVRRLRFRGSEADMIVEELTKRADGMFLWVVCQLEHLSKLRIAITPNAIKTLPRSLERTFEQSLLKLDDQDRVLCLKILRFVLFSKSPMDLPELVEAIAVTEYTSTLNDVRTNKLRRETEIFEICGSLLRQSQATGKVEISHYSVYEFLTSPVVDGNRTNSFYLSQQQAVLELAVCCLRYLSLKDIYLYGVLPDIQEAYDEGTDISPELFVNTPFLQYAASNWCVHSALISKDDLEAIWRSVIHPFFSRATTNFDLWVRIVRYIFGQYRYPKGTSPLHVAALHGLETLAALILDHFNDLSSAWGWQSSNTEARTPLHIAIENGNDHMINALTAKTTWLTAVDENGRTPLHIAIEQGSTVAVTQLVSGGADINLCDQDGRTAVSIAIENCWEDLSPLLTPAADASKKLPDGRNLLHLAVQSGSMAWASPLLLSHPGLRDEEDHQGWTPLHYAANNGHVEIVEHLLRGGAYKAVKDHYGWTPLHAAIRHQYTECARLILVSENIKRPPLSQRTAVREQASHSSSLSPPAGQPESSSAAATRSTNPRRSRLSRDSSLERDPSRTSRSSYSKYGDFHGLGSARSNRQDRLREDSTTPQVSPRNEASPKNEVQPVLLLAIYSQYADGVQLLVEHGKQYGSFELGFTGINHECLEFALSASTTSILQHILPLAPKHVILDKLPKIVDSMSTKAPGALQNIWTAKYVYEGLFPEMLSRKQPQFFPLVEFFLQTWAPSSGIFPSNILHLGVTWEGTSTFSAADLVRCLIKHGADISWRGLNGKMPFEKAITNERLSVAEVIIQEGDLDTLKRIGILHEVFKSGLPERKTLDLATLLVARGFDVNASDAAGIGICEVVADFESTAYLRWALNHCTDPWRASQSGNTAIHVAVQNQRTATLRLLLRTFTEQAPDELAKIFFNPFPIRTPMVLAAGIPDVEALTQLIEVEQTLMSTVSLDGDRLSARKKAYTNALCRAIKGRSESVVNLLVAYTAHLSEPSSSGELPLVVAVQQGHHGCVNLLLEHGANPNLSDGASQTPLRIAIVNGQEDLKILLRQHGAKAQPADLTYAITAGDSATAVDILDLYPDNLDCQREALAIARRLRREDMIQLILVRSGDRLATSQGPFMRDAFGDTVLHRAIREQQEGEVQRIIDSLGIDKSLLNALDFEGDTPLKLAVSTFQWVIVSKLVTAGADKTSTLNWAVATGLGSWEQKVITGQITAVGMRGRPSG